MEQLVGQLCVICGRVVDSIVDGRYCDGCEGAVHVKCSKPPPNDAASGKCPVCGSDRGEIAAALQQARQSPPPDPAKQVRFKGLFGFFQSAAEFVVPDEAAVQEAGTAGERHSSYHKRIVFIAIVTGVVAAAFALTMSLLRIDSGAVNSSRDARAVIFAPLLFGAGGVLFGVAMGCLFAPDEFLTSPLGKKWMKLIGTKSVTVARAVCLIFGLVVMAPFVAIGLVILLTAR